MQRVPLAACKAEAWTHHCMRIADLYDMGVAEVAVVDDFPLNVLRDSTRAPGYELDGNLQHSQVVKCYPSLLPGDLRPEPACG